MQTQTMRNTNAAIMLILSLISIAAVSMQPNDKGTKMPVAKPQPKKELVIERTNETSRHIEIGMSSEKALDFIKKEANSFGTLNTVCASTTSESLPMQTMLTVNKCFDPEEVSLYLASAPLEPAAAQ
ncbi:hypothetical protein A9Q81_11895 [Gammaproteobacteria bacterium 42_54_T18]|nr:hypothetical protein A9Q81_11895 [Gammaproteobacteria bacterium 42_54_T18]